MAKIQMLQVVMHIVPNAWRVYFNLSLLSFKPNVKGLRNLIDLSLSSPFTEPPPIIFLSSVGIFNCELYLAIRRPLKKEIIEAEIAMGSGDTESNQLCGGKNGAWNKQEWFPSLVWSANALKSLPVDDKLVSWVPLDLAARVMVDSAIASLNSDDGRTSRPP
ncbi:hypothetical protein M422DRAFT_242115 [Sphaerobolus stellatus SS14]|nr:hypothetical protein M422DRAFT_242115 [Sphaerobolus stellatus SS14]